MLTSNKPLEHWDHRVDNPSHPIQIGMQFDDDLVTLPWDLTWPEMT
jgi:hypothetical protein